MGTVLASAILDQAATTLLDVANTRWSDADKLIYLNDGQRQICKFKIDSNVVIDAYQLVEGTKQRIPDGTASYQNPSAATLQEGLNLLDVIRNMGLNGTTSGGATDPTDLQQLNAFNRDWHTVAGSIDTQSYCFDERYPDYFFVYPPQPGAPAYVEVAYQAMADDVAAVGNAINISDQFQVPLYHYILHRAYAKDAALSPLNVSRSVEYWNLFVTELGRLDLIKKTFSPNTPQPKPSPALKERA